MVVAEILCCSVVKSYLKHKKLMKKILQKPCREVPDGQRLEVCSGEAALCRCAPPGHSLFRAMGEEVLGGLDGPLVSPAQLQVGWTLEGF